MDGLAGFLAMGGYGGFVWPAYGVALVVLAGILVHSLRRLRATERLLAELGGEASRRGRAQLRARRIEAGPGWPEEGEA